MPRSATRTTLKIGFRYRDDYGRATFFMDDPENFVVEPVLPERRFLPARRCASIAQRFLLRTGTGTSPKFASRPSL